MSKIKIFALGGNNENGKNMYVVEVNDDIFVFDAGLKFVDENMYGIDYIIPDFTYLKENSNRIVGLFLSHGHEENMGATVDVALEIPDIKIYATKFTYTLLKKQYEIDGIEFKNVNLIKAHVKIEFGDKSIFPISVTHSIPDSVGYILYTDDGAICYTGDFLFDPKMKGCYKTDIGKLAYIGKQGVLCLLSESMYASLPGHTSPRHRVAPFIREILSLNENRIIFNIFSSHIYRIQELFDEVMKTRRKIVIMGKRLQSLIGDAIDEKYIIFDKERIGDLSNINDTNIIILISDERDKPFLNIARVVNGYDKYIKLLDTDTVVFLEPVYEGSEKASVHLLDDIAIKGANVITLPSKKYLSLHASSEDLMLMIDLMKPKYYVPVRGEYRKQVANADVASGTSVKKENILLKENGDVLLFVNGILQATEEKIKTDSLLIDGKSSEDIGELVLKDRQILSDNGIVIVSAMLDKKTKEIISGPEVITRGFIYVKENGQIIDEIEKISSEIINENNTESYVEYNKIKNSIRERVSKYLYKEMESKPMIITVIQEM